jgi:hypothetical protein
MIVKIVQAAPPEKKLAFRIVMATGVDWPLKITAKLAMIIPAMIACRIAMLNGGAAPQLTDAKFAWRAPPEMKPVSWIAMVSGVDPPMKMNAVNVMWILLMTVCRIVTKIGVELLILIIAILVWKEIQEQLPAYRTVIMNGVVLL